MRVAEVGMTWEEVLTDASGTFTLRTLQTFRVKANAAVTVTIDGVLAMTMATGEIVLFNSGQGAAQSAGLPPAKEVIIVITGNAYVQVARDNVRKL
jgi:hypothetical protein